MINQSKCSTTGSISQNRNLITNQKFHLNVKPTNYRRYFFPTRVELRINLLQINCVRPVKILLKVISSVQTNTRKWLKVEGSANSIHIEKKLYYALATKKRNILNYDDEFDILKKSYFSGYFINWFLRYYLKM